MFLLKWRHGSFAVDCDCHPVDARQNRTGFFFVVVFIYLFSEVEGLSPSATTRLSLSFALIICCAPVGLKSSTQVIFIPGPGLTLWVPRSINSLKVVNKENAT